MTVNDGEARVREMLAPLRRIEPVALKERRSMRQPRPITIALAVVAAFAIVGVAIAAGIGAFSGIGAAQPITIATFRRGPHEPPVSFGVARDGVTAVSFRAHRHKVTVPVKHNVWAYEGMSNVLRSATVHYANGTTTTLNH